MSGSGQTQLVSYKTIEEGKWEFHCYFRKTPQSLKSRHVGYSKVLTAPSVFSCTLSSRGASIPFYLIITPLHINNIILPSHFPQLLTVLIKLLAFLPHLQNFVSSSFSTPQRSTASDPLLFLSSHLFLVPTLLLSAAPFPLLLRSRLKYEETIKLCFISI